MVPCLAYWLWDPPCQCSPMVTSDNAMWVRIVDVIVMPIKRCFDIGDGTQNTNSRHSPVTQNMFWQKSLSRMTDYTRVLPTLKSPLVSGMWSHGLCTDPAMPMIPGTDWGQIFLFATVWAQIRSDNRKQDKSWARDTQLDPEWHILRCHRCLL